MPPTDQTSTINSPGEQAMVIPTVVTPARSSDQADFSTTSNTPQRNDASFIVISLQRPTLEDPWDMALSMFADQLVVVGDFATPPHMIRGFWSTTAQPFEWFSVAHSPAMAMALTDRVVASQQLVHRAPLLYPGDVLLAVNRLPIACFATTQLTKYMSSSQHVALLVFRYNPAVMAAWRRRQELSGSSLPCVGLGAAVASQIVRSILMPQHFDKASSTSPMERTTASAARALFSTTAALPEPTNPLFQNAQGQPIPYCDNAWVDDPEEGERAHLFLHPHCKNEFPSWLQTRKHQWRSIYKVPMGLEGVPDRDWPINTYINPLFRNAQGQPITYCDNTWIDPDEGQRAHLFLNPLVQNNLSSWLQTRKRQWRSMYKVYPIEHEWVQEENEAMERCDSLVAVDFWSQRGFASFHHWMRASTAKWKQTYRWNRAKRQRLEHDMDEVVQLETDGSNWQEWLRVRKNQWLVMRRKRQRERLEQTEGQETTKIRRTCDSPTVSSESSGGLPSPAMPIRESSATQSELIVIDAMLEEQERERRSRQVLPPLDILALFDVERGCPDDVVAHCLSFLEPSEHGKLLGIDSRTRRALINRGPMWRQLCPSHWKLPRRPRKPWHELYLKQLRAESQLSRKKWESVLMKASSILWKGDQLQSIEKLVTEAERGYNFDVNYVSGVVCERNSLLNLAVINKRHKVARWLVETKQADIESCDRGNFTPLLNAAWAGDRYLVRFFLQRGADRAKVGTCHYTKPLAAPDFKGFTAEEWAKDRGFSDIAELIRLGL